MPCAKYSTLVFFHQGGDEQKGNVVSENKKEGNEEKNWLHNNLKRPSLSALINIVFLVQNNVL